ncbi:Metallo-dependent phosphatase-like protein [Rhypophila decipiens]|uniref:Metallo-dependent phosphatase-like protein n=1 Tax=Rhypophila decipiens TaxID=261697 RepID=A0AAN7B265_9PEZI|nr:Metallo-dependent phosphatase-like protein [Rhypophila decipiens]
MFAIILGVFLLLSSPGQQYPFLPGSKHSNQELAPLSFNQNGRFRISIFEDLHFGENAWDTWGPAQDVKSVGVINQVLDSEPDIDFVVLNGDLITGENTFVENSTLYLDQMVAPIVERNLTWSSTYGNHDSSFNLSRNHIFDHEVSQWPLHSRTRSMVSHPNAGVSNYYLPVYPRPDCTATTCLPALILWFFDSRGGHFFQQSTATGPNRTNVSTWITQADWVDENVVTWFQETNSEIQSQSDGKVIPSLAFVHIPINASHTLQEKGINAHKQPGVNEDNPIGGQGLGWCADGRNDGTCAYGEQDVPFMKALASTQGLVAVFSGHDHGDTWCARWDGTIPSETTGRKGNKRGLDLCFGQHTGHGGYGNFIRGGRQVLVTLDGIGSGGKDAELDTWIRLENGNVVGAVTLNNTYGHDVYPVTPDERT